MTSGDEQPLPTVERPLLTVEQGAPVSEGESAAEQADDWGAADDQQVADPQPEGPRELDVTQPEETPPADDSQVSEQPQPDNLEDSQTEPVDEPVDEPVEPEAQWRDDANQDGTLSTQTAPSIEPANEAVDGESAQDEKPTAKSDSDTAAEGTTSSSVKKQVVANGNYIIRTGFGYQLVLDTKGTKKEKKANVLEAAYKGGTSQSWRIKYDRVRELYQVYRIASDGSKLYLNVNASKAQKGTNVLLWSSTGKKAQWWDIVPNGSGFNFVSALKNSLVLNVANGKAVDGTNVEISTRNGTAAQRFLLYATKPVIAKSARAIKDGTYEIVCTIEGGTSNVADVASGSLASGANVRMYKRSLRVAQRFHFSYNEEGYYEVVNVGSGRALDAKNSGLLPGTNVQQATNKGRKAQQWVVKRNNNGTYSLINRANGLMLAVAGSSIKSGANIKLATPGKGALRQFKLHRIKMLPAGLYTIKALSNTTQVIDVKNGSSKSGATIQMHKASGALGQKFELQHVTANEYRIRTAASGGWLTASKSSNAVTQRGNHSTAVYRANTWCAEWANGHFVFVNKATGKALTMAGGKTANGTKVTTAKKSGAESQQFTISPTDLLDAGCYFIANLNGPYLDIDGDSPSSGANVLINAKDNSLGQHFYLQRSGSAYRIKNAYSGKYVGAVGTDNSSNVTQQSSSSSNRLRWKARIADGGGVMLVNVAAKDKVLDVAGGKTANGTNVRIRKAKDTREQAWKLIKTTYKPYPDYVLRAMQRANASSSSTGYFIVVDRNKTHTIVMTGGNGHWKPYKNFLCTVGKSSTPTVTGSFSVGSRGYSFGSGYTCYYWTQFYADYLFHSVLYNEGTRTIQDGRLGAHASHGCVRLAIDNAHWIYSNIPSGTRVLVY